MAIKSKKNKKVIKKRLSQAIVFIQASFNNTLVSISDLTGNVVASSSSGKLHFTGTRKATPHAASLVMQDVIEKIKDMGVHDVQIRTNGVGMGREPALRALASTSINIISIEDVTPVPHNGPRPPKPRRV